MDVPNLGYWKEQKPDQLKQKLITVLEDENHLLQSARKNAVLIDGRGMERITRVMSQAYKGLRKNCLFIHKKYRVVKREKDYTLFQCKKCKDLFLYEISDLGSIYGDKYFLEEYKTQYGRSYVEDRKNIQELGCSLSWIQLK